MPEPRRCSGCYDSFSGPWCDNCDGWPCDCVEQPPGVLDARVSKEAPD